MYFWFLFLEVYLHRVNLLNFLCRVLFVSFISYDTLNKVLYVCMYVCMYVCIVQRKSYILRKN